jgi:GT2 family glycosyltransferase
MEGRICAVVVTYNRKDLILECLNALRRQTYSLDAIYVIDNGSTDGTQELFMKEGWITETVSNKSNESIEKVFLSNGDNFMFYYIRIEENCGSSGGFYEGIKRAYEKGYDWIWVMDDDALPKLDALEKLVEFGDDSLAAICSVVLRRDTNEIHLMHRRIFNKWTLKEKPVRLENYQRKYFYLNEFSYVGTLINSKAIKIYGFTDKSFFFCYDDTEHSLRLSKYGKIICVTSSYVLHGPKSKSEVKTKIYDYKRYYGIRNRIFVLKKYGNPFAAPFYIGYLKLGNYAGKILKRRDEVIYNLYNEAILDGSKGNLGMKMPYLPDVCTHIKNE